MAKGILPQNSAVLYLRMSSAKQDKSIPAQRDELLKLAQRHDYKVVREYVDPAVSGDDTERRTGFLKLREDCENGPDFSIILVWHEDRFSRNDPLEYGYWLKPIRDSGVILETPTGRVDWESLGGRLLSLIGQEMRHDFLRQLSRNVTRGLLSSAKTQRVGTGGASPQGLRNDPERAAIVRRIFAEYLKPDGSLRSVAELLNREGILSPRGKPWSVTTVRFVLRNRKYCGDFVRFKYRAGKYNAVESGEVCSRSKADRFEEVEPMVVEGNHEAIIDRATFEAAQAKLRRQKRATAHRSGRQYVFSSILVCADCGQVMAGVPYERGGPDRKGYRCHRYQDGGSSACFRNQVKEDMILDTVVRKLQEKLLSETAIERLLAAYRRKLEARRAVVPTNDGRLRKRVEDLDRQIDQGAERVLSAPETLVGTLYAKIDRLRIERDRLQAQLDTAGRPVTGSVSQDDRKVEDATKVLRDLREAFKDADPLGVREHLRYLVSKVELQFSHRQAGKRMKNELQGGGIFVRPGLLDPSIMQPILDS